MPASVQLWDFVSEQLNKSNANRFEAFAVKDEEDMQQEADVGETAIVRKRRWSGRRRSATTSPNCCPIQHIQGTRVCTAVAAFLPRLRRLLGKRGLCGKRRSVLKQKKTVMATKESAVT